jgi:predicted nucleotidyltransferase
MALNIEILRSNYRDVILQIAAKNCIGNVRVFGSVARGEAHEASDLDLLVQPQAGCSLLKLCAMENAVSDMLGGIKVDVLTENAVRDELAPFIVREAVPL